MGLFGHTLLKMAFFCQTTCVGTPQQNRVAERKNRHLAEVVCSVLFTMNVPKYFLGEAVLTAQPDL